MFSAAAPVGRTCAESCAAIALTIWYAEGCSGPNFVIFDLMYIPLAKRISSPCDTNADNTLRTYSYPNSAKSEIKNIAGASASWIVRLIVDDMSLLFAKHPKFLQNYGYFMIYANFGAEKCKKSFVFRDFGLLSAFFLSFLCSIMRSTFAENYKNDGLFFFLYRATA